MTSDNPRSEEPDAIIAAIVAGAEGAAPAGEGSALEVEADRRAAIERAMEMARPGDIVLIAGKGHEQGQEFEGGRKVPFDDRDVARDALRGLARRLPRITAAGDRALADGDRAGRGGDPGRRRTRAGRRGRRADAGRRGLARSVGPGDLFVGLAGERADGGAFAAAAIEAGAWGAIVTGAHAASASASAAAASARVFESEDPLAALGALARAWLDRLRQGGCRVVGITGSTGKTSTKDILLALARPPFGGRVHANRENFNTEVGLPLTALEAEEGTDLIVLEMAMRGMGQIRELARIARPDVGVITNVGPVHLELVGTVERVARGEGRADRRAGAGRGLRRAGRGGGAAAAPALRRAGR